MSDAERKELNSKAIRLISCLGISPLTVVEYFGISEHSFDVLRSRDYGGYAHYYLKESYDDSELINKAEIEIYKKLLEIDSKLGTAQTEQLFACVMFSLRMDLITVTEIR